MGLDFGGVTIEMSSGVNFASAPILVSLFTRFSAFVKLIQSVRYDSGWVTNAASFFPSILGNTFFNNVNTRRFTESSEILPMNNFPF
jgi:hypothetical protein